MDFVDSQSVELIDSMGGDVSVCRAARVSTGNDQKFSETSAGLINYLMRESHSSPFEHVQLTFRLEVNMFTRVQILRHRTLIFNEQSARYSEMPMKFWIPPTGRPMFNAGSGANPLLVQHDYQDEVMESVRDSYEKIAWDAAGEYAALLEVDVPTEIARAVLPQNLMTSMYVSGSLWNFLKFIQKRTEPNAQHEVREIAVKMLEHIETIAPLSAKAFKEHNS